MIVSTVDGNEGRSPQTKRPHRALHVSTAAIEEDETSIRAHTVGGRIGTGSGGVHHFQENSDIEPPKSAVSAGVPTGHHRTRTGVPPARESFSAKSSRMSITKPLELPNTKLRQASISKPDLGRQQTHKRQGSVSTSSGAGSATGSASQSHAPSPGHGALAIQTNASPGTFHLDEPFSPAPLSAAFLRARTRWHKALGMILDSRSSGGSGATSAKAAFIASSPLLSSIAKEKHAGLTNMLRKVTFERGATIYKKGDYPFLVYFIAEGTCVVETTLPGSQVDRSSNATASSGDNSTTKGSTVIKDDEKGDPSQPPTTQPSRHHHQSHKQDPILDAHVTRVIDGWFKTESPSSTAKITDISVPLFLLTSPDCLGEREALGRMVLRDCTVRCQTPVTAYVLRRLTFRQLTRGRVQRLLQRTLELKELVIRARLDHALRRHLAMPRERAKVQSRLALTPFAARALERQKDVLQWKRAVGTAAIEEEKPSISAAPTHAATFLPYRSATEQEQQHRSLLLAQARYEHAHALLAQRKREEKERRVELKERGDQYKFGFKSKDRKSRKKRLKAAVRQEQSSTGGSTTARTHRGVIPSSASSTRPSSARSVLRQGGRRVLNSEGKWVHPSELESSSYESDSDDSDDSDEHRDEVAQTVWHAFPHAYSEAQWHVYSVGAKEIDPYQQEREEEQQQQQQHNLSTHQAIMHVHQSRVEAELAKTDAKNAQLIISSPFHGSSPSSAKGIKFAGADSSGGVSGFVRQSKTSHARRPSTAIARARMLSSPFRRVGSIVPSRPPAPLPLSASFAGSREELSLGAAATEAMQDQARKQKDLDQQHKQHTMLRTLNQAAQGLNTRMVQEPPATLADLVPPSLDGSDVPILSQTPLVLPQAPPPSLTSLVASSKKAPMLSFFSASLLRHLESHYLRATEVDPISYTGKWMFFIAPALPEQMPTKPRPRKPKTWRPFSLPDEKREKILERKLEDILTTSPLQLGEYLPPPPPLSTMLSQPKQGEWIELIEKGGNANAEHHWKHLLPKGRPQTAGARSVGHSTTHSTCGSAGASPNRSRMTTQSHGGDPNLRVENEGDDAFDSPSIGASPTGSQPNTRPSSATGIRPSVTSPLTLSRPLTAGSLSARTGKSRQHHPRHPSMDMANKTYTFRVGHSDGEREVVLAPQQRKTDWQFEQLKRGRMDLRDIKKDLSTSVSAVPEEALMEVQESVEESLSRRGSLRGAVKLVASNPVSRRGSLVTSSTAAGSPTPSPPQSSRPVSRGGSRASSRPASPPRVPSLTGSITPRITLVVPLASSSATPSPIPSRTPSRPVSRPTSRPSSKRGSLLRGYEPSARAAIVNMPIEMIPGTQSTPQQKPFLHIAGQNLVRPIPPIIPSEEDPEVQEVRTDTLAKRIVQEASKLIREEMEALIQAPSPSIAGVVSTPRSALRPSSAPLRRASGAKNVSNKVAFVVIGEGGIPEKRPQRPTTARPGSTTQASTITHAATYRGSTAAAEENDNLENEAEENAEEDQVTDDDEEDEEQDTIHNSDSVSALLDGDRSEELQVAPLPSHSTAFGSSTSVHPTNSMLQDLLNDAVQADAESTILPLPGMMHPQEDDQSQDEEGYDQEPAGMTSSEPTTAAAASALLASFDPRLTSSKVIRKTLADTLVPVSADGTLPAFSADHPSAHPYPPKHASAVSLASAQSHAYVYGAKNPYASDAIRFLSANEIEHNPGSLTARRHVGLGTAAARAHSLLQQLQQFTVKKAPVPVKAISQNRAFEDFGHYSRIARGDRFE